MHAGAAAAVQGRMPELPPAALAESATKPKPNEHVITAPMVGTFYAAPSPGAKPFVEIGDEIPVELYKAVAEVLIFVMRQSGQLR